MSASPTTTVQSDDELIDATLDALTANLPFGLDADQAAAAAGRMASAMARQPAAVTRRALRLANQYARITAGSSTIEPDPKDRRFSDEWFANNPIYRQIAQGYLAWSREFHGLVEDLDLDDKSRIRSQFLATLVTDAAAPTNQLLGNPAAIKEALHTGGSSLVDGLRHWLHDLTSNGGMPSTVDSRPFTAGDNIAATPGAVIYQDEILEVIQYAPTTDQVHHRPLLILPPQINKYYVLDLAPQRSLVEHAVSHGHQVFMISWRNPGPQQRDWGLDDYARSVMEAMDASLEITGSEDLNLMGVCAGGITMAGLLGHLTATGDTRVNAVTFLVTVLDWSFPSMIGSLMSGPVIEAANRRSQTRGILAGEDLASIFAWLRPNDLVWNYWSNNYLMGKNPPAYDVLAWNADSTNLPAALHSDFMSIAADNALAQPDRFEVLGTPVDLAKVDLPTYVVGAVTDHIIPWQAAYETVNLLAGDTTFVLSSQGHIQALVNPSGNPKGQYWTNPTTPQRPEDWLEAAEEHAGSWWDHWVMWLSEHGGAHVEPPAQLGSSEHPELTPAPGSYVFG